MLQNWYLDILGGPKSRSLHPRQMFQHPSLGRVGERKDSLLHEKKDEVWFATSWYKFDFFHSYHEKI